MSPNTAEKQIIDLIKRSEKILILPSSPPDGDSLGSALAMHMMLQKLGKQATIVCSDTVPELLKFLPNSKLIGGRVASSNDFIITFNCQDIEIDTVKTQKHGEKFNLIITPKGNKSIHRDDISFTHGESNYDLIITVDCAELSQLQGFYEDNIEMFHSIPVVNIDHHVSNDHFGKINYVDIMSSSTTELLLPLFEQIATEMGIEIIDEDIATLLLTGIITDTGSFQNANTTPKAFAKAAQLIGYGARQQEIIQNIYKTKQLSQLKLWGRVLSKIQTDEKHRVVWSTVSKEDLKDTESSMEQTGDIIDELMTNAPGAEVVLLIKEKDDKVTGISIRTTSATVDGSAIAEHFGGGGHTQAAGCRIEGKELREAEYELIKFVRNFQAKRLGFPENSEEDDETSPSSSPENHKNSSKMINVEALQKQAEQAQKATEEIQKVKDSAAPPSPTLTPTPKTKTPASAEDSELKLSNPQAHTNSEVIYKFED